jgi:two-component system, OmpR family, phosphate regulon sensor histidine kinase PhoR
MTSRVFRFAVGAALAALICLMVVQIYWFRTARELQEHQFDTKVNLALRSIADHLLRKNNLDTQAIAPVKQTASNSYFVSVHTPIRYASLDSLVRKAFTDRDILQPFNLVLFNESDSIILGNAYTSSLDQPEDIACVPREQKMQAMNFAVEFPEKDANIIGALNLWVFSAGIFALIILLSGLLIMDLARQKRLAVMKNDFISNMTHELQTPIANISMASEVLKKNQSMPADKQTRYLSIIHDENLRLKNQVEQVLQAASMEKGQFALASETVDLHHLLAEVIERFRLRIDERLGFIRAELKATNPFVTGDANHLRNLFNNLLDNAEKYSPGRPEINVSLVNTDDAVVVNIEDKGIGMSADIQQSVFDKFYRAASGNVHDVKGFGLGLTYVKNIVDAHRGKITVKSKLNSGSCFTIFFPNPGK